MVAELVGQLTSFLVPMPPGPALQLCLVKGWGQFHHTVQVGVWQALPSAAGNEELSKLWHPNHSRASSPTGYRWWDWGIEVPAHPCHQASSTVLPREGQGQLSHTHSIQAGSVTTKLKSSYFYPWVLAGLEPHQCPCLSGPHFVKGSQEQDTYTSSGRWTPPPSS